MMIDNEIKDMNAHMLIEVCCGEANQVNKHKYVWTITHTEQPHNIEIQL